MRDGLLIDLVSRRITFKLMDIEPYIVYVIRTHIGGVEYFWDGEGWTYVEANAKRWTQEDGLYAYRQWRSLQGYYFHANHNAWTASQPV